LSAKEENRISRQNGFLKEEREERFSYAFYACHGRFE